jgi:hypothetical protein
MRNKIQENVKQKSTWIRGLYMILFAMFYSIAEIVLFVSVIVQFCFKLFTGETNPQLLKLGQSIATYIYQIIQFLTFKSEYHVYPLGAWPKGEPSELEK